MRSCPLILLLGIALTLPTRAQNLDARIDAASQRWQDYQERLQSTDPVIRAETLAAALRDENNGIRNGALRYALRSRVSLSISLVIPPGSSYNPGSVPVLEVTQIQWDKDQGSLAGRSKSQGRIGIVRGELNQGMLRVVYEVLGMAPDFGASANVSPGRTPRVQTRRCAVVLSLVPSRDALEGPLQCEGMSQIFTARLPFG